jgi:hypothetical protein
VLRSRHRHYADDANAASIAAAVEYAKSFPDDKFVILDRSDREFIQAATNDNNEWELEYGAAQMERPNMKRLIFGCDKQVPAETVIKVFRLYRADNIRWTEVCSWTLWCRTPPTTRC